MCPCIDFVGIGLGAPGGDGLPIQPAMTSSAAAARVPPPPPPPQPRPPTAEPSTSVYVSGLPKDITQEDIGTLTFPVINYYVFSTITPWYALH